MSENVPLLALRQIHAAGDQLHVLELTDACQDLPPRALQVVPFRHGDVEESLDRLHVLRLHLSQVVQEGELREGRDERIALELEIEEAYDPDGALEALQAELDDLEVVSALQGAGETSQEGDPGDFEHRLDVHEVGCAEVLVARLGPFPLRAHERAEQSL